MKISSSTKITMGVLIAILTLLTPAFGSIIALYSKVDAHDLYIDMDKDEKSELRKDLKKILEDTNIIKGQLKEMKRSR